MMMDAYSWRIMMNHDGWCWLNLIDDEEEEYDDDDDGDNADAEV